MEYSTRHARYDELDLLREIEQDASTLFRGTAHESEITASSLSLDFLTERLRSDQLWVAADTDDIPVGFAAITVIDGLAHLYELSVAPAHGRRGIGKRLVLAVCEWAKQNGFSAVTLSTYSDIPWNAPFYERLGFHAINENDLSQEMLALRRREAEDGLNISRRVIMKLLL